METIHISVQPKTDSSGYFGITPNSSSSITTRKLTGLARQTFLNSLSFCDEYLPELESIHLGIKAPRFNTLIALHGDVFRLLTDEKIAEIKRQSNLGKLCCTATFLSDEHEVLPTMVIYFSKEEMPKFELRHRQSFDDFFSNFNSKYLGKNTKEDINQLTHCIVIIDEKIFIHPKIDPLLELLPCGTYIEYRTNHSSLSHGKAVTFAGILRKVGDRWEINNISGHYATPSSKLETCLFVLQEKEIPLENVYFAGYTIKKKKAAEVITTSVESMSAKLDSTLQSLSDLSV